MHAVLEKSLRTLADRHGYSVRKSATLGASDWCHASVSRPRCVQALSHVRLGTSDWRMVGSSDQFEVQTAQPHGITGAQMRLNLRLGSLGSNKEEDIASQATRSRIAVKSHVNQIPDSGWGLHIPDLGQGPP